jgi:hypothetical protein
MKYELFKQLSAGDMDEEQHLKFDLPLGYISGFEIQIDNGQVTITPGIASIRGQTVFNDNPRQLDNEQYWLARRVPEHYYHIYMGIDGELIVDAIEPAIDPGQYSLYHPEYASRWIGAVYVDKNGQYTNVLTWKRIRAEDLEAGSITAEKLSADALSAISITAENIQSALLSADEIILGYSGTGNQASPQEGDSRIRQSSNGIYFEVYRSYQWLIQAQVGGPNRDGIPDPNLKGFGLLHPDATVTLDYGNQLSTNMDDTNLYYSLSAEDQEDERGYITGTHNTNSVFVTAVPTVEDAADFKAAFSVKAQNSNVYFQITDYKSVMRRSIAERVSGGFPTYLPIDGGFIPSTQQTGYVIRPTISFDTPAGTYQAYAIATNSSFVNPFFIFDVFYFRFDVDVPIVGIEGQWTYHSNGVIANNTQDPQGEIDAWITTNGLESLRQDRLYDDTYPNNTFALADIDVIGDSRIYWSIFNDGGALQLEQYRYESLRSYVESILIGSLPLVGVDQHIGGDYSSVPSTTYVTNDSHDISIRYGIDGGATQTISGTYTDPSFSSDTMYAEPVDGYLTEFRISANAIDSGEPSPSSDVLVVRQKTTPTDISYITDQYYNSGQTWNVIYRDIDLVLQPADDGKIVFLGGGGVFNADSGFLLQGPPGNDGDDGEKGDPGIEVYVQETEPASANNGDIWIEPI